MQLVILHISKLSTLTSIYAVSYFTYIKYLGPSHSLSVYSLQSLNVDDTHI